nr:DUF6446 family protein [Alkalilacustris brevis]
MGRLVIVALLLATVLAGGAMYYLQVYGYYDRLPAQNSFAITPEGAIQPVPVAVHDFQGIDSGSSPIRYRACFTLADAPEGFTPYPAPTPLTAPHWFGCFDAAAIGAALEGGEARAYLAQANFTYGFDRVVAVFPDGRAYAWQQINACGEAHFDGNPLPPHCPPPPSS